MRKSRLNELTALRRFVDGAFFATLVFLTLFMVIDFKVKDETWVNVFGSFVVAAFTIAAAWVALRGNRIQITQNEDLENSRRINSLIAAKAVLPSILSELNSIAQNNLLLNFPQNKAPKGNPVRKPTELLRVPESVLPALKECIQYSDPVSQERLANILRHFQVYDARHKRSSTSFLTPHYAGNPPKPNYNEMTAISSAIGWAVIHALISDAYDFARGSKYPIPATVTPDRVKGAFLTVGVMLENYPALETALNGRINRGKLEQDWSAN
ncbi:hypothetical protein [Agrobacterium cavarae]|uniref:hypothetical protein n=1 Tax=Agrobacterium cavarae TaxID=2528239 RepID=UPI0028AFEB62|nr:hypothetical protein [Agrobacterium cavarae]